MAPVSSTHSSFFNISFVNFFYSFCFHQSFSSQISLLFFFSSFGTRFFLFSNFYFFSFGSQFFIVFSSVFSYFFFSYSLFSYSFISKPLFFTIPVISIPVLSFFFLASFLVVFTFTMPSRNFLWPNWFFFNWPLSEKISWGKIFGNIFGRPNRINLSWF